MWGFGLVADVVFPLRCYSLVLRLHCRLHRASVDGATGSIKNCLANQQRCRGGWKFPRSTPNKPAIPWAHCFIQHFCMSHLRVWRYVGCCCSWIKQRSDLAICFCITQRVTPCFASSLKDCESTQRIRLEGSASTSGCPSWCLPCR